METKPELHRGLTLAESMQVSLDYLAQGDITEEIIRFKGINIDMLDSFTSQIAAYKAQDSLQANRQVWHDKLHTWARETAEGPYKKPNEVIEVALRTAGVTVMNKRNDLKSEHEKVNEAGCNLALTLREYLTKRVPDISYFVLNGQRYELEHEVITVNKGKYLLTFATGELFNTIARRVYDCKGQDVQKCAKYPLIQDWEKLLRGLEKVAKT